MTPMEFVAPTAKQLFMRSAAINSPLLVVGATLAVVVGGVVVTTAKRLSKLGARHSFLRRLAQVEGVPDALIVQAERSDDPIQTALAALIKEDDPVIRSALREALSASL